MVTTVILEFDGVLFKGNAFLPSAKELVSKLVANNKEIWILTNSSRFSAEKIHNLLMQENIEAIPRDRIITSIDLTIAYLKKESFKCPYICGNDALIDALASAGFDYVQISDHEDKPANFVSLLDKVDAVIVAEDPDIGFIALSVAVRYIYEKNVAFLTTDGTRCYPSDNNGYRPGALALSAPIQTASYSSPTVIGKPSISALSCLSQLPDFKNAVFIGIDEETDVPFAEALGSRAIIVQSNVEEIMNSPEII